MWDNGINFGGWEVVVLWKENSNGALGGWLDLVAVV